MQFKNVIGQQEVKNRLKGLVERNRLSHALLFLAKDGAGGLPLAIAFAQYVLCEKANPKEKAGAISLFEEEKPAVKISLEDSCGECASCRKVQQLIHPDLHFSYPALKRDNRHDRVLSTDYIAEWRQFVKERPYGNVTDWIDFLKENSKSKIESPANKQGNITVHECEDISRKLSLKAFESRHKVLVMWMPEFLGNEGNRLLKLIEEPPPDTLFIFVAESEDAILPTILSRTQLVKIPSLSNQEVENELIETFDMAPESAASIAAISEGNFREALQLMKSPEEDYEGKIREWLNVTLKNNVNNQLKWIDEISRFGREKQKQFLKYFVHLLEQAIRVRYLNENDLGSVPSNERDFGIRLNNLCGLEAQQEMISELEKCVYYIERNAHAKMLFHSLTIRMFHIIKDNSLILVK